MPYGVTPQGFSVKPLEQTISEVESNLKARIDSRLNTSSASLMGQFIGILCSKMGEIWELGQAVDANVKPRASGYSLDERIALTGVKRSSGRKSTVTLSAVVAAGYKWPAGSIVSVDGQANAQYVTLSDADNEDGIVNTTFSVLAEARGYGPTPGNAETITKPVSPTQSGATIVSVTNPNDAQIGRFAETDSEARARQQDEIATGGSANTEAVREKVAKVAGVLSVSVRENTLGVSVGGLPPHSMAVMVYDGNTPTADNQKIAQALWASHPGGIEMFGDTYEDAVDADGKAQPMGFSRADILPLYYVGRYAIDPEKFPSDGEALLKNAIATWASSTIKRPGSDVIVSQINPAIFSVPGIVDVIEQRVGLSPTPTETGNYVVDPDEVGAFDTSRISFELVTQ